MFGYVIADLGRLTEAQRLRYHSVYCGLCRALYADYGATGALAVRELSDENAASVGIVGCGIQGFSRACAFRQ